MGMSTSVTGFKPPDEKWKKMKAVWDACQKAKIEPPDEVADYFGDYEPDDAGVRVDEDELTRCGAVYEIHEGHPEGGYAIDVKKLPKDVTVVHVENSW